MAKKIEILMSSKPQPRNVLGIAMILAAVWVTACLAAEHFAGVWEPSEVTGRKGNLLALIGTLILIGWVAAKKIGSRTNFVRRFLRGLSVAFVAAVTLGVAKYLYFYLVWGDFSIKMADFTQRTLQARGADPRYIQSFVALVRRSWQTPRVAANSFLSFLVWGGVWALLLAAISGSISWLRSGRKRAV